MKRENDLDFGLSTSKKPTTLRPRSAGNAISSKKAPPSTRRARPSSGKTKSATGSVSSANALSSIPRAGTGGFGLEIGGTGLKKGGEQKSSFPTLLYLHLLASGGYISQRMRNHTAADACTIHVSTS